MTSSCLHCNNIDCDLDSAAGGNDDAADMPGTVWVFHCCWNMISSSVSAGVFIELFWFASKHFFLKIFPATDHWYLLTDCTDYWTVYRTFYAQRFSFPISIYSSRHLLFTPLWPSCFSRADGPLIDYTHSRPLATGHILSVESNQNV